MYPCAANFAPPTSSANALSAGLTMVLMTRDQVAAVALVLVALAMGARSNTPHVPQPRARLTGPFRLASAGWCMMWKLVLSKIPLIRAMAALPELPKEPPSPRSPEKLS